MNFHLVKINHENLFWIKDISLTEERGFGLDPSNVTVENSP